MHIVKRRGHKEKFDERKIYASCYAACMSCHIDHQEAEKLSEKVTKELKSWIRNKKAVNSHQISMEVTKRLRKYNKHAAYMYETHLDIS